VFFLTDFRSENCYSAACPKVIRLWLLLTFFAFYLLQGLTYGLFKIRSRKTAFAVFMTNSAVVLPGLLVLNIWGNMIIEDMDKQIECSYSGFAQSMQMIYLISTYCIVFVYIIFLLTIKETLKRYYAFMDRPAHQMNQRLDVPSMRINLVAGRSLRDWQDGIFYSLYFLSRGRIGSAAEREYIDAERAAR